MLIKADLITLKVRKALDKKKNRSIISVETKLNMHSYRVRPHARNEKAVCLEATDQTEMPFLQYMAAVPLYR